VQLNPLVEQIVDLTRARWSDMPQQRGIVVTVRKELAPDLPVILGSASELREALTNLVFNAVDAMPEGGTLTLRTAAQGDTVLLEVTDTGIGMDEEARQRCLEPFFTTKGERGTGLGLAMVYGIVKRHGAGLDIQSAPGKGTTLRIAFPLPQQIADPASTRDLPVLPQNLKLLLIDDDPHLLKSLREILELEGHRITAAGDGATGVEEFRRALDAGAPFDLVITDLGMPRMDGRAVAQSIKQMSPATPVILVTGWGQRPDAGGESLPHIDRVVGKPPKLQELRRALAQCCNSGG
jgi:CheY-like chemotaxis protein